MDPPISKSLTVIFEHADRNNCLNEFIKMEQYGRMRKNAPKEFNSMNKFVRELSQKNNEGEFLKAHDMLVPSTSQFPNLSRLSLKRAAPQKLAPIFNRENFSRNSKKPTGSSSKLGEIEYLPVPPTKKSVAEIKSSGESLTQSGPELRPKFGRDLLLITGSVQFVMKTFKLHPELLALYEVFGNIMKMRKGKIRFEYTLVMKSEVGPVLQGVFYDFDNIIPSFGASSIRCVGQFTRQNRFHIHKIEELSAPPAGAVLSRIQNVSGFTLLQSQSTKHK